MPTPPPSSLPTPPPPSPPDPPLLLLPPELRHQIYTHLLLTPSPLTIRAHFIRLNFRSVFMAQHTTLPKNLCTPLLRVCRQITDEALPVLYGGGTVRFDCCCRVDQLVSQIGRANFAHIRWMCVDADDLAGVVAALGGKGRRDELAYRCLEILETEGYRAVVLSQDSGAVEIERLDAIKLCWMAGEILRLHPCLNVLVQKDAGAEDEGEERPRRGRWSDGVNGSYDRVKWRFVRDERAMGVDEQVVDLKGLGKQIQDLMYAGQASVMAHGRQTGFATRYVVV